MAVDLGLRDFSLSKDRQTTIATTLYCLQPSTRVAIPLPSQVTHLDWRLQYSIGPM